jgi:hypothetical protein
MQTSLSGDVALEPSSGGVALGSIRTDLEDDLGLNDESGSLHARIELETEIGRWNASVFRHTDSGTGVLDSTFGNIPAGTPVDASLSLTNLKAAWMYDFDTGVVRLSPGIGIDLFDIETSVRSVTPVTAFEEVEVLAPVPMVFLQAELDLDIVAATVDAGGMSIDLRDAAGTYWDLEGLLRVPVVDHIEVFGGFRYIHIDADGTADGQRFDASLDLTGWIVGGIVRF